MALSANQYGIVYVGLMDGKLQYKRSVAVLVAEAFLPEAADAFDTPIHLDGDKANCRVDNLLWRPYWFARKYHRQFYERISVNRGIEDVATGEWFHNSLEAAARYGLLDRDIGYALGKGLPVWPTQQRFQLTDLRGRF